MKIQVDKIESGSPHALSVRDVRCILKSVPPAWVRGIREVRIANSLERWKPYAFFSRYDGCLTIYSRRGTQQEALEAVLSELAAISLGIDRGLHHRPKAVQRQLSQIIGSFVRTLLPKMTRAKKPIGSVNLEGFREMQFAPVPNDPVREKSNS